MTFAELDVVAGAQRPSVAAALQPGRGRSKGRQHGNLHSFIWKHITDLHETRSEGLHAEKTFLRASLRGFLLLLITNGNTFWTGSHLRLVSELAARFPPETELVHKGKEAEL